MKEHKIGSMIIPYGMFISAVSRSLTKWINSEVTDQDKNVRCFLLLPEA